MKNLQNFAKPLQPLAFTEGLRTGGMVPDLQESNSDDFLMVQINAALVLADHT